MAQGSRRGRSRRRLAASWALAAIGLLSQGPAPGRATPLAVDRVGDIRERLAAANDVAPAPAREPRLAQYWGNFPNFPNWPNWANWGNWGNWGGWVRRTPRRWRWPTR